MAYYALLDENNKVINVISGVDENIIQTDLDGTQVGGSTEAWEEFYATRPWLNAASCKRTSYNNNIRKQYAALDYTYNPTEDIFVAKQPYPSWLLDENFDWQAPTPKPEDGGCWIWNEPTLSWIDIS